MKLINKTQQLEKLLRDELNSGRWSPGDKLPSEDTWLETFEISRPSLREAVSTLAGEGILIRKHGSGTYLLRRPCNRVELFVRLENIANVSGYWYRYIAQELRTLASKEGMAVEIVTGFGNTASEFYASLERRFCQPNATDLAGVISLVGDEELDMRLGGQSRLPYVSLNYTASDSCRTVILDYKSLAKEFNAIMARHGYQDFTLIAIEDPEERTGSGNYRLFQDCVSLITDGGKRAQLMFNGDYENDARHRAEVEQRFMAWFESSRRTRAAVFFDDGIFCDCLRVMHRHRIRIPEDLAVLTHANVGREFESILPHRIGFDPRDAAVKLWQLFRHGVGDCRSVLLTPVEQPGETLPDAESSPQ